MPTLLYTCVYISRVMPLAFVIFNWFLRWYPLEFACPYSFLFFPAWRVGSHYFFVFLIVVVITVAIATAFSCCFTLHICSCCGYLLLLFGLLAPLFGWQNCHLFATLLLFVFCMYVSIHNMAFPLPFLLLLLLLSLFCYTCLRCCQQRFHIQTSCIIGVHYTQIASFIYEYIHMYIYIYIYCACFSLVNRFLVNVAMLHSAEDLKKYWFSLL